MTIKDNYSITDLFFQKKVTIFVDNQSFVLRVPTLADFYNQPTLNRVLYLWHLSLEEISKFCFMKVDSKWEAMKLFLFEGGQFHQTHSLSIDYKNILEFLIEDLNIDYNTKILTIKNKDNEEIPLIITEEIWDYILYILKLSCGEKVIQPPTFDSPEARELYLAQQEREEKIKRIKASKNGDKDGLIKAFLAITYAFPSLTFDYLFNQTMAQIQWLQKYAAGAVSYEVNAKAFAAGNVKKGKKLDFFIK